MKSLQEIALTSPLQAWANHLFTAETTLVNREHISVAFSLPTKEGETLFQLDEITVDEKYGDKIDPDKSLEQEMYYRLCSSVTKLINARIEVIHADVLLQTKCVVSALRMAGNDQPLAAYLVLFTLADSLLKYKGHLWYYDWAGWILDFEKYLTSQLSDAEKKIVKDLGDKR